MKSETKRFLAVLDKVEFYPESDQYFSGKSKHGHMARVKRASLTLCQFLAEFRCERCGGTGVVAIRYSVNERGFGTEPCPACDGKGKP